MTDQGTISTNDTKYQVIVNGVVILRCDTFKEAREVYDRQCYRLSGQEGHYPGGTLVLVEDDRPVYEFSAFPHSKAEDSPPEKQTNSEPPLDTERRVAISLAVGRYLRSADRFNDASREFTGACKSLRKQLGPNQRFFVQVDFKHYIVASDRDGNFDVESIQTI